ncbi:MAG: hypothetical protein FWH38_05245 [Treponema sp.]|nr:hypothetical protein [Treponema sp.]
MKLTGSSAHAYLGFYDEENKKKADDTLEAGEFYFIIKKDNKSSYPAELPEGVFFRAKAGEKVTGEDQFLKLDEERLCKTSASFSMEQGSVDAGDDCDGGAQILDGIVSVSGSISGLFRYDDVTGEFNDVTEKVISHFLPSVEEEAPGVYNYLPRDDSKAFLLVLLNGNAAAGQTENWLFVPVNLSSVSLSLGNTEAQSRELSWTKAEGQAIKYTVKKAS